MPLTPDLEGFAAAQKRLREQLGVDAVFMTPVATTYDPSVPVDEDSGRPLDPFAAPTSGGEFTEEVVRASFVTRPLASARSLGGERTEAPGGVFEETVSALIVDPDDYERVKNATRVRVHEKEWQVEHASIDSLSRVVRWIFYLEDA